MQSEDEYKSSIRKCLNRIIQNVSAFILCFNYTCLQLTDDGNLDFDSHAFQSLVAEVAKKEHQETELIIEVFLELLKVRSLC